MHGQKKKANATLYTQLNNKIQRRASELDERKGGTATELGQLPIKAKK